MPSTSRHLVTALLGAGLLLAGAAVATPAARAGVPRGFPADVSLPPGVIPVFLSGQIYRTSESGADEAVARFFELDQQVKSPSTVQRHFDRIFKSPGWSGAYETQNGVRTARFERVDGVRVEMAIKEGKRLGLVVYVPIDGT